MTDHPLVCPCGHPHSWHRHDLFAGYVCLLCSVCGLEAREHWPTGHKFTECDCESSGAA
jgi:hypothetical protein